MDQELKKYDKTKEMSRYNNMHRVRSYGHYGLENPNSSKQVQYNTKLAKHIHDSYNKMTSNELQSTVLKCLTEKQMKHIILNFELFHHKPESKAMSLDNFTKEASRYLERYQSKAGGFLLDDISWKIHRNGSKRYDIEENEVLFENSICKKLIDDPKTRDYLEKLESFLDGLADNITVDLRFKDNREDKLSYVLIWICDKTAKKTNKPKIGL